MRVLGIGQKSFFHARPGLIGTNIRLCNLYENVRAKRLQGDIAGIFCYYMRQSCDKPTAKTFLENSSQFCPALLPPSVVDFDQVFLLLPHRKRDQFM